MMLFLGIDFDLIDKYAIYTEDEGLVGIQDDAPEEAKEEYKKLKEIMDREIAACGHI